MQTQRSKDSVETFSPSEVDWTTVFKQWKTSKMSQVAFCKVNQINYNHFIYQRSKQMRHAKANPKLLPVNRLSDLMQSPMADHFILYCPNGLKGFNSDKYSSRDNQRINHCAENKLMLRLSDDVKIYVYIEHIDMRKSIDGLVVLLADSYKQNPQTGDLFIFTNKQKNKIKLLFWDSNGFVLYYKKMDRGKFCYSRSLQGDHIIIDATQLRALLMGLDFYLIGQYDHEFSKDFF